MDQLECASTFLFSASLSESSYLKTPQIPGPGLLGPGPWPPTSRTLTTQIHGSSHPRSRALAPDTPVAYAYRAIYKDPDRRGTRPWCTGKRPAPSHKWATS